MIYYKHFIGDYQRKTNRLSILEDGVYRRLLDEYYSNESPLPLENDACFRLVRAIKSAERKAVLKILSLYFTETPSGYIQDRANEQIVEYKEKSAKASQSSRTRWDAKGSESDKRTHMRTDKRTDMQPDECERNAIPDTNSHIPNTTHQKSKKEPPISPKGDDSQFESFWNLYPKKVGKQAALRRWKKIKPSKGLAEAILNSIRDQVDRQHFIGSQNGQEREFIPNPSTWLNEGRWEDGIQPTRDEIDKRERERVSKEVRELRRKRG